MELLKSLDLGTCIWIDTNAKKQNKGFLLQKISHKLMSKSVIFTDIQNVMLVWPEITQKRCFFRGPGRTCLPKKYLSQPPRATDSLSWSDYNEKRTRTVTRKRLNIVNDSVFPVTTIVGPAKSVGCAVRLVFRGSQVRFSGPAPSFAEILSWNNFYDHSLPTADSRSAVVSYWRKYGHLIKYWLTA